MAEQEMRSQDDELDVEELEEVAGGVGSPDLEDGNNGCNSCPNINCPC